MTKPPLQITKDFCNLLQTGKAEIHCKCGEHSCKPHIINPDKLIKHLLSTIPEETNQQHDEDIKDGLEALQRFVTDYMRGAITLRATGRSCDFTLQSQNKLITRLMKLLPQPKKQVPIKIANIVEEVIFYAGTKEHHDINLLSTYSFERNDSLGKRIYTGVPPFLRNGDIVFDLGKAESIITGVI